MSCIRTAGRTAEMSSKGERIHWTEIGFPRFGLILGGRDAKPIPYSCSLVFCVTVLSLISADRPTPGAQSTPVAPSQNFLQEATNGINTLQTWYNQTTDARYLSMAESIFSNMTTGWDDTCGGGIWWNKSRTYKNAIANELFLSVSAHLANRVPPPEQSPYLSWAIEEWRWFAQSGMINSEHLIDDGLTSSCQNNGETTWTYNQGVILDGLVELYRKTADPSAPATAQQIASSAITHLTVNGILHDPCEPNCGADGVQFKGIFVRNLMALDEAFPHPQYERFLDNNAESIWDNAQGPNYQFGQVWSGPFDGSNAGIQSSALDCIVAAAQIAKPGPPL
jgi:predicted alpha-1,6-mannanase (GH76 family)